MEIARVSGVSRDVRAAHRRCVRARHPEHPAADADVFGDGLQGVSRRVDNMFIAT